MLVWTKVRRRNDSFRKRSRWLAYDSPNATQSGRPSSSASNTIFRPWFEIRLS